MTKNYNLCADCPHRSDIGGRELCAAMPIKASVWALMDSIEESNVTTTSAIMNAFNQDDARAGIAAKLAAPALAKLRGYCNNYPTSQE